MVSSMLSSETRLGIQGELAETKFHRSASAPLVVSTLQGSRTLPLLFDIF